MSKSKTKRVKAWAVMQGDFLPDFNIVGKMADVYQIHSTRVAADCFKGRLGRGWKVIPVTITYSLTPKKKK